MGVLDGQPVNAAVTNPAFINKNINDTMPNILGFINPSTPSIADIQKAVNTLYTASGASESQSGTSYNIPQMLVANGQNYQTAIGILGNLFDSATGHMHTGTPGDGPLLAVVRSLAVTGASPQTGNLTLIPGTGILMTQGTGSIMIAVSGGGGGGGPGVESIAVSGSTAVTGDVTLIPGTGILMTQVGTDITIAVSGGVTGVQAIYNTASASLSSSFSPLTFSTLVVDTDGAFDTSTGIFTVPKTQTYTVKSRVLFTFPSVTNPLSAVTMDIYLNGSSMHETFRRVYLTSEVELYVDIFGEVPCVVGDQLQIYAQISSGFPSGVTCSGVAINDYVSFLGEDAFIQVGASNTPQFISLLSGSGTQTIPEGCTWLEFEVSGDGGGGDGAAGSGGSGSGTTFGPITCNGGGGAVGTSPGSGGVATIGSGAQGFAVEGGVGGAGVNVNTASGGSGGVNPLGGNGSGGISGGPGFSAAANTGAGGGGLGGSGSAASGAGGGAGGYAKGIIISPASSISYSVGGGGAGGGGSPSGGNGASGVINLLCHFSPIPSTGTPIRAIYNTASGSIITSPNNVLFTGLVSDPTNAYDPSTGLFTCARAGFLTIDCRTLVNMSTSTPASVVELDIFQNGSMVSQNNVRIYDINTQPLFVGISQVFACSQGDTFGIFSQISAGVSSPSFPGSTTADFVSFLLTDE